VYFDGFTDKIIVEKTAKDEADSAAQISRGLKYCYEPNTSPKVERK
jgi:hypothetical protein